MSDKKTFEFSKEEKAFLDTRDAVLQLLNVQFSAVREAIRLYVATEVVKRLGVDLTKNSVSYDVRKNEIVVTPSGQEEKKDDGPEDSEKKTGDS